MAIVVAIVKIDNVNNGTEPTWSYPPTLISKYLLLDSGEILNKLKSKGSLYHLVCLHSTYDFLLSILHCLIILSKKN